jgi:hypothetical protein
MVEILRTACIVLVEACCSLQISTVLCPAFSSHLTTSKTSIITSKDQGNNFVETKSPAQGYSIVTYDEAD